MTRGHAARTAFRLAAAPLVWLLVLFAAPFAVVLKISFAEPVVGQPPYTRLIEIGSAGWRLLATGANYVLLATDALYVEAYLNSLRVAATATLVCLLIGYPMAYAIARAPERWRNPLLMLVVLPFWTSFLIRVYAWIGILSTNGILNNALIALGIIDDPIPMMNTNFAVYIGIVYSYLPFMVLPLYATLVRMDLTLLEAAADLGCRPWQAFRKVTLPLSWPGIAAGSLLVFIPSTGEFVIPDLLGGADSLMIGKVLWTEFFGNRDWPVASALATVLLVVLVGPMLVLQAVERRQERG